ncbi:MAG: N-6 DNA methylase [Candidatus Marinimicrobia bacterium]|nr:N-6 DNA methylase [Candidatus Neomarinimicrobiota bacterium]
MTKQINTISRFNEISKFLWETSDGVLRGLFRPSEYINILIPFVVMRRLDFISETTKHDMKCLISESDNPHINFKKYLNSHDEDIVKILNVFELERNIEKLSKSNLLIPLVDIFLECDLSLETISNNHMEFIFEGLLFFSSSIGDSGSCEDSTPRDIVELLVSFIFSNENDNFQNRIRTNIFDPCFGHGGFLKVGKNYINQNVNDKIEVDLFGQEINQLTHSLFKLNMIITGQNTDNFLLGSSISQDQFPNVKFDYMMTHPPFGLSFRSEKEFVLNESKDPLGRFSVGIPQVSDGSLLFLQSMISKMNPDGSRIGILLVGSPLFTGDSGSGESEIRKWIIESDWLECIVSLPDQLFFNTGISTYIWIVNNNKSNKRKGKVQLVDGSSFYKQMKKSLGNKRKEISDDGRNDLLDLYLNFEENDYCKILSNDSFGYTRVIIEQPLYDNDNEIVTDKNGNIVYDDKKKTQEKIPLSKDIDTYYTESVKPHLKHSRLNRSKDEVGYEIEFNKYFQNGKKSKVNLQYTKKKLKYYEGIFRGYSIPSQELKDEGEILYLTGKNIKNGELVLKDGDKYLDFSDKYFNKYEKSMLKPGDIIITTLWDNKKIYQFKETDPPSFSSGNQIILRTKENDYLSKYLKIEEFYNQFENDCKTVSTGIIPSLSLKKFLEIEIFQLSKTELDRKYEEENVSLIDKDNLFISINKNNLVKRQIDFIKNLIDVHYEDPTIKLSKQYESQHLEFKSTFRTDLDHGGKIPQETLINSVVKTIGGFCNSDGGNLLIGVDDNNKIVGIEVDKFKNNDVFLLNLTQQISNRTSPNVMNLPGVVEVTLHKIESKTVCKVYVEPTRENIFVKYENKKYFYKRTGPKTVSLDNEEMMNYVMEKEKIYK